MRAHGTELSGEEADADATPVAVFKVEGRRVETNLVAGSAGTATKTDTALIETPQSVSVIPAERFELQGAQTVRQTLNDTAGLVSVSFDSRGDNVTSRGGSPATLVDGLQNNFGFYNTARLDPFMLDQVKVLRGPSSVLYSQGSVDGVINYSTKKPLAERHREIQVQISSHNRCQVKLDLNEVLDAAGHWRAATASMVSAAR